MKERADFPHMSELQVPPYQNAESEKILELVEKSNDLAGQHKATKEKKGDYPPEVKDQLEKIHREIERLAMIKPQQKQ